MRKGKNKRVTFILTSLEPSGRWCWREQGSSFLSLPHSVSLCLSLSFSSVPLSWCSVSLSMPLCLPLSKSVSISLKIFFFSYYKSHKNEPGIGVENDRNRMGQRKPYLDELVQPNSSEDKFFKEMPVGWQRLAMRRWEGEDNSRLRDQKVLRPEATKNWLSSSNWEGVKKKHPGGAWCEGRQKSKQGQMK